MRLNPSESIKDGMVDGLGGEAVIIEEVVGVAYLLIWAGDD